MIAIDRVDVLNAGISLLSSYQVQNGARGRFIAVYLGLRRMGDRVAPLGSKTFTPVSEIENYLDLMWKKRHRVEPMSVLTAPFGGSTGLNAGYSTSTGLIAPVNKYPTNTWRNNLNIQKGVGCAAEPEVIAELLRKPELRMACPHMQFTAGGGHVCGITGTAYRGEEQSIWLASGPAGYQVVDLDIASVYEAYLKPNGRPIPIFPLIAVIYSLAPTDFYPMRQTVGIPDFAADFGFELSRVEGLFDCDPGSPLNEAILTLTSVPNYEDEIDIEQEGDLDDGFILPDVGEAILLNSGLGAELAVAHELQAMGWSIRYTANQQLLGYDLHAAQDGISLFIEVKSSVGFTTPELTQSEWTSAQAFGDQYVLAIVDFWGSDNQTIWYVRDPAESIEPAVRMSATYRFPRRAIEDLRTEVDFL